MSATVIETRRVLQPGPARYGRVLTALGAQGRQLLGSIHEGESLESGLVRLFAETGEASGTFRLLGGALSEAWYHVALPDPDSPRAVDYGAPIHVEGGAWLIGGSGSFGPSVKGGPLIHLHGALAATDGRGHGGHLNNGKCIVGAGGVRVLMHLGAGFSQAADPETGFSTFFPQSETSHDRRAH
ncbi:hypothetical protein GCM10009422_25660 [Brevundimonas kwangchunensis]|uniref:PPC domain-containing protein n=1 Tax=Brevundimonas kwangchunensis TaxID=322163 RepID=A0ABN1H2Z4_9CAUL